MLCNVGLRTKGYIKVCSSIDETNFAVSDSSQSLVNVIFFFFLKYLI